jgi:hypothetical protein
MATKHCFPLPSAIVPTSLGVHEQDRDNFAEAERPRRSEGSGSTAERAEQQPRASPHLEEKWPIDRQLMGDFRPSAV